MASNASTGAYYKRRTSTWLRDQGWQVADLEIVRWVYRSGSRPIPQKRDQFASDLLAVSYGRIAFIQVKGGLQAIGNGQFPAARRAFAQFVFPDWVERWVVAWAPRAREPRIVTMSGEDVMHERDVDLRRRRR